MNDIKIASQAVLSNITSAVTAMIAPFVLPPQFAVPMMVAAFALAVLSGGFHAVRNWFWQRLDVWGVILQILAVFAVLLGHVTVPVAAPILFVLLGAIYFPFREDIELIEHVLAIVAADSVLALYVIGWWALLPIGLFLLGGFGKLLEMHMEDVGQHGAIHSWLWHQPVFLSVLSLILLL